MIRRPPRSTQSRSSAASDVYKRQVQDLRTAREDAILYQQDLNVYINYNNTPVVPTDPTNKNNRSYLFETFQYGYDQTPQVDGQHYIPIPTDLSGSHSHFTQRVLQYGIVISLIAVSYTHLRA